MQRDAARLQKEEQEKEKKEREAATAEMDRQRREAEAHYRSLTSYMPMVTQNILNNGINRLMSKDIVRPVPVHPRQDIFPPQGYFNPLYNPFLNPIPQNVLPPMTMPTPVIAPATQAMIDHNDYLLNPVVPLAQLLLAFPNLLQAQQPLVPPQTPQPNPSPTDNSSPSTLSSASDNSTPPSLRFNANRPRASSVPRVAPTAPLYPQLASHNSMSHQERMAALYTAAILTSMPIIGAMPNTQQ